MSTLRPIKFSHARTAFKFSLKILGLKEGSVVLIPDFICESVLHPLYALNIKPCFYQIKDDMTPNWTELNTLVNKRTKAILMVHYFGQPQNIEKFRIFCDLHKLYLIEDNAHGHGGKYNGRLLGSFGDIGFSSPRKILNLYSGGILFINREDLDPVIIPSLPEYPVRTYMRISNFITAHLPRVKFLRKRPPYEDPQGFPEPIINDYFMDSLSKNKYNRTDWDKVRKERQKAYKCWYSFAKRNGLKPVINDLDSEASPWCFPAYLNDLGKTTEWFDWGWKNGYQVIHWPTFPEEIIIKNDSAIKLCNKLICFPIKNQIQHNGLGDDIKI